MCTKIALGVEKTEDESMSAIRFWKTPKGDLLHYSFIFMNLEPLGTELNDMLCSRLGIMLYLEKKGE